MDFDSDIQRESEAYSIDLTKYIKIINRRKLSIIIILFAFIALGAFYLNNATPIYSASVKLQADPVQPNASAQDQYLMNTMVFLFYETQYEIIQSRTISESVVEKLDLIEEYADKMNTDIEDNENGVFSQIKKFVNPTKNSELSETDVPLTKEEIKTLAAQTIQSSLTVKGGTQSQIINISFESDEPEKAAEIANAIADSYIAFGLESRLTQLKDTSSWLSEQLNNLKAQLQESEDKLRSFRLNENLVDTEQQARLSNSQLQNLNSELIRSQTELSEAEELYLQVQEIRNANGDFRSLRPVISNNTIRDLVREESTLGRRTQELSERYGEKHPKMIAARSDYAVAENNLSREVIKIVDGIEREFKLAKVQVENIRTLIRQATDELQSYQGDSFELTRLEREVENNRRIYESFLGKLMEADLSSDYDLSNIRIIDRATVPEFPIKPRPFLIMFGCLIIGLISGVSFALLREFLGNQFRTPEQIESELNLPVLGVVPTVSKKEGPAEHQYIKNNRSTFAEGINSIRTGILFSDINKQPKSILVTSTHSGEGKTTLAINLAISFSQLADTLLLELDLRKPVIAKDLDLDKSVGLSDLLTGQIENNIHYCVEGAPNLKVVTCGSIPTNPIELLSSSKFLNILEGYKNKYKYIIIDSPPVLPVSDSLVMSKLVDTTVMAIKAEDTKIKSATEALYRLRKSNAPVSGAVFTQASIKNLSYYGDYYYHAEYYGKPA